MPKLSTKSVNKAVYNNDIMLILPHYFGIFFRLYINYSKDFMLNSTEARISNEILRWARTRLNLTLEDAAEKIEVTLENLSKWENGTSYPTIDELFIISEVYSLPASMFYLSEIPKPPILKRNRKAKRAVKYLKSVDFTPDDYNDVWEDKDDIF